MAAAFCDWLSRQSGGRFSLPSEAQWEYACRAGSATAFWFGRRDADFSPFANMADATIRDLAYKSWSPRTPDIVPRDDRFNDRALVSAEVGAYKPNPWGLFEMHGNVWEWCWDWHGDYPGGAVTDPTGPATGSNRVFRGGSWRHASALLALLAPLALLLTSDLSACV